MIGQLHGTLVYKKPPMVAIKVGGITYELDISMNTIYQLPSIGSKITLFTHFLVREDAHLLYGFFSDSEREMFRLLLKINGVGARTALAVLSGMSADDLAKVVSEGDTHRLVMVPGIGKKTAERMLLELKDRSLPLSISENSESAKSIQDDVLAALLSLGYGEKEIIKVIKRINLDQSLPAAIKEALQFFTGAV